jgi:TolB-like protein
VSGVHRDQVETLFARLAQLTGAERAHELQSIGERDPTLADELASLLEAHDDQGELDRLESRLRRENVSSEAAGSLTGRVIGQYEILELTGQGGMGDVYRARDTRLDRDVALKFLPTWLAQNRTAESRFVAEARAVSALDHPNVCALLEFDRTSDGQLFLVTPFYEGRTLEAHIRDGPFRPTTAVRIALQVAKGLAAAHRAGIVHRDIKPSNLLITPQGRVKILDFGIAKLADVDLTRPGETPGTVRYMAPEQASGEVVDGRADLWSLGLVLREMLLGKSTPSDGAESSLSESHDAGPGGGESEGASRIPPKVAPVLDRLLQPAPVDRYPDAGAAARALAGLLTGDEVQRQRSHSRTAVRLGGAVIAMAMVLLGSVAVLRVRLVPMTDPAREIQRIAVLPLENRMGSPDDDDFVDYLHEEVIGELTRLGAWSVISRQSVLRFAGTSDPVDVIGRQLNVDVLMTGTVRLDGDTVRVRAELTRVGPETSLWVDIFSGPRGEALGLPHEIGVALADHMGVPQEQIHLARAHLQRSRDPRAVRAVTAGRALLEAHVLDPAMSLEERERRIRAAIDTLEYAVAIDSTWSTAHARLAGALHWLGSGWGPAHVDAYLPRSREAALRAIQLNPNDAGAHASLGFVQALLDRDFEAAERSVVRGLLLEENSNNHWLAALVFREQGKWSQMIEHYTSADMLDPHHYYLKAQIAAAYACMGDVDGARLQLQQMWQRMEDRGIAVDSASVYWELGRLHSLRADYQAAIPSLERALLLLEGLSPARRPVEPPLVVTEVAFALAQVGERREAERLLEGLELERWVLNLPKLMFVLGDTLGAVRSVRDTYRSNRLYQGRIAHCVADFGHLRAEPAFHEFLTEIGLQN